MRFVPLNCIREGMVSAKQLFGKNGELMLNAGSVIRESYIEKIKDLGYNGIYIDDELSKDIIAKDLISDNIKSEAIKLLKRTFFQFENQKDISEEEICNIERLVNNILDEIISNNEIMVNIIDIKVFDDYTFYHSLNVALLSLVIGLSLGLNRRELYELGLAAILHDIGKVFIAKEILNKPSKLTDEEFEIIAAHSYKGYEYLKLHTQLPAKCYIAILHHHEKYDGSGYPFHLKGEGISLFGRIISVADVYDALTSDRPYRKAVLPSEAIEYIMSGGGTIFDPKIAENFVKRVAPYPVGICVVLSDNRSGLVLESHIGCSLRPKIKIIKHGTQWVKPYVIDLKNDISLINVTIIGVEKDF